MYVESTHASQQTDTDERSHSNDDYDSQQELTPRRKIRRFRFTYGRQNATLQHSASDESLCQSAKAVIATNHSRGGTCSKIYADLMW